MKLEHKFSYKVNSLQQHQSLRGSQVAEDRKMKGNVVHEIDDNIAVIAHSYHAYNLIVVQNLKQ